MRLNNFVQSYQKLNMKAKCGKYIQGDLACGIGIKLAELGYSEKTLPKSIFSVAAALDVTVNYIMSFTAAFDDVTNLRTQYLSSHERSSAVDEEGWEDGIKAKEEITSAKLWCENE